MTVKLQTIKGRKNYSEVFTTGKKFFEKKAFAAVLYKESESQEDLIYFSVTVPKKAAKKAVVRNRIKRLVRESFRQLVKEDSASRLSILEKIAFVWKSAPKNPKLIALKDVKPVIELLINRAVDYKISKTGN